MADYKFFQLQRAEGVTTIFLDKPPVNSLEEPLYVEFERLCDELDNDAHTRAVLFASKNPKIFIAGADIKDMQTYRFEHDWVNRKITRVHGIFNRLEDLTKPTIAVIQGHALGGGCEFALAADFRFMSRGKARIGLPEVNLGIIPGGGGTQRLPRVVGYGRAVEMMMTGRHLDAGEAERIGLIHRACDPEKTLSEAQEFARQLAGQAPVACALIKRALRQSLGLGREEGLRVEREHCLQAVLSADAREGIAAFVEKRKPKWTGK